MQIVIKKDIGKAAADIVLKELKSNPKLILGLATGSTPIPLYKELVKKRVKLNETFNLDEYYPIKGVNSYKHFMNKHLFSKVKIKKVNFLDGEAEDAKKECKRYEELIDKKGISLQILGIGSNGHIGFNEPGSGKKSKTRLVELSASTRKDNKRFFRGKVPKYALSMGVSSILRSEKIVLMASGRGKARAIRNMVEGPMSSKCPASFLRKHPDVTVVLDADAASLLKKTKSITNVHGFNILNDESVPKGKNILVISPHPDDSAIGLGATIAKLAEYNKVHTFVMTSGHRAYIKGCNKRQRIQIREKEVREECKHLGDRPHFLRLGLYDTAKITKKDVRDYKWRMNKIKPDIIFIPRKGDNHPTHKLCRKLVVQNSKAELWEYEGPWSMFQHKEFNTLFAFDNKYKKIKERSILTHRSQIARTRYDIAALALERLRGALIEEQELFGFGMKSLHLGKNFELFNIL